MESTGGAVSRVEPPYFYPQDFGDALFVGRDSEMVELHYLLGRAERVAIAAVGMGGIGKTTLARRYVRLHEADYPGGIWWVSAGQLQAQVLDYAGRSIGLEDLPAEWDEGRVVRHYLARWEALLPGRKLLVLDDVGAYGRVKGFLPERGAFRILMTTRVQMQRPVQCLQLGVLAPEKAMELLWELVGIERELVEADVAALCEWLGYLPLGIELVGRYLSEVSLSVGEMLGRLRERALTARALSAVPEEMDYGRNVAAAIELSWLQLDEVAQRVALLLGVFALAPVEPEWVVAALPDVDAELVQEVLDRQLVKRSLLNREEGNATGGYRLHSLVREFLRGQLALPEWAEERERLQAGFARAMVVVAKTVSQVVTVGERRRLAGVVPHMEVVVEERLIDGLEDEDKTWCCEGLKRYFQSLNLWREAENFAKESLAILKSKLGDRHPYTAGSLNNLALLYSSQGRYVEAEPLHVEALEIRKSKLGDRHPDTAQSLNNLAALYKFQGRYAEAEPLYVEALEIWKSKLGDRHSDTSISLNNLAELYRSQGRYAEAEPLYVEALEIRKNKLGDRHPNTARSLNNLALLYVLQGHYGEAEPLYVEALEIRKSELGDHHPDTAQSLNNLALLYVLQGHYDEAESLYVEALEIRKSELGDRHPDTAQSLNNLAGLYCSQGRYAKAEPLYVEALEIWKSELGDRHPDTATSLNNLAELYRSQGRYGEAEPLYVEALEIQKSELGDRHPDTAQSLNNLAGLYYYQGRYGEAEPLYVEALEICKSELGDRHPDTAGICFNLAGLYHQTDRSEAALALIQQALSIFVPLLGDSHPTTQAAMSWAKAIEASLNKP